MQKLNSGALNRILLFVYILSLSTNAIAQNKNNSKETYLLPPHGNYVYGRVIEKVSILFSALTHIIHKPTFAP